MFQATAGLQAVRRWMPVLGKRQQLQAVLPYQYPSPQPAHLFAKQKAHCRPITRPPPPGATLSFSLTYEMVTLRSSWQLPISSTHLLIPYVPVAEMAPGVSHRRSNGAATIRLTIPTALSPHHRPRQRASACLKNFPLSHQL